MIDYRIDSYCKSTDPDERAGWFDRRDRLGAMFFGKNAVACGAYALFFTFCLYKNACGITILMWMLATIGFSLFTFRQAEIKMKKDSVISIIVMSLLGISTFLTCNVYIVFLNYVGFFLTLVHFLLHNVYNDKQWSFLKTCSQILGSVFGAISFLGHPFMDFRAFCRLRKEESQKERLTKQVLLGVLIAFPALLILGCLLLSADRVFSSIVGSFVNGGEIVVNTIICIYLLVFGFLSSYCGIRFVTAQRLSEQIKEKPEKEPIAAITFSVLISILYVCFVFIQIKYLFLGNMQLPKGLTYAEYARSGFFQLLFVSGMNLFMVLLMKHLCRKNSLLNALLLLLCACTLVMIASSAFRMVLYIEAYRLTFLRIFVLVTLLLLLLLVLGAMIYIVKPSFSLFRYSMLVVSVIYLLFSFSHVDYFIARYNLYTTTAEIETDYAYLETLSTDAAPVIADFINEKMEENKGLSSKIDNLDYANMPENYEIYEDMEYHSKIDETQKLYAFYAWYWYSNQEVLDKKGIRSFNISRFMAQRICPQM